MKFKSEFLNEIKERGFVYQDIDIATLDKILTNNKISGYIGFDITGDSLHIGSLIQLMLLHWRDSLRYRFNLFAQLVEYRLPGRFNVNRVK